MTGSASGEGTAPTPPATRTTITFDRRSVWRAGWTIVAVVLLTQFLLFVFEDGGAVLFVIVMSWAASIALEPAVSRLSRHMKRHWATLVSMLALVLAGVVFAILFGGMLADQVAAFVASIPELARSLEEALASHIDTSSVIGLLGAPADWGGFALGLAGGLFGFVASVVGSLFSVFTFAFFTYYLSADSPRLRRWLARLFPPAQQEVVGTVWELAITKTGGYVAARLSLATISGATTALFLFLIGMPYWLALGIWTGIVAQFVPTVGTYIAIALPVAIGLLGENPIQGVLALIFAVVYQQIENLFFEPKMSAKAVDVHPAVSFGAVMLGASLFGVAGAFIAVPTAALILALFEIYVRKYEVLVAPEVLPETVRPAPPDERALPARGLTRWLPGRR